MPDVQTPETFEEVAAVLARTSGERLTVQTLGAGTKLGWAAPALRADVQLCTSALDRIVEHNVGDLTAVVQAGVPLAHLQAHLAESGQMLAIDPPLGERDAATLGGVFATADSGPLCHRYGAPRDLVLGMTVALSDGTLARSGGKVIKNVAGYDLAKLFTGSLGTLGVILSVSVRLHPRAPSTATATGTSEDPKALGVAARALSAAPLELEALDVAWRGGRGGLLARCAGLQPALRAQRVGELMAAAGLEQIGVAEQDEALWARQRAGQRSRSQALVRVTAPPSDLGGILDAAAQVHGTLVGRATLGTSFVALKPDAVPRLRELLGGEARSVVLDQPDDRGEELERWDAPDPALLALMTRVKTSFDPTGTCSPGTFVGGI